MYEPDEPVPLIVRVRRQQYRLMQWLTEAGAILVWPFERMLAFGAHLLFVVSERFAGFESLLMGLVFVLLWPVRMFWRLASAIGGIVPESVQGVMAAPLRLCSAVWHGIVFGFMRVAEAFNLDGMIWRLVKWTLPIWYPVAALWGFFQAWLVTRSIRQMVWGLPVVIVVLPLAALGGWTAIRGTSGFAKQYNLAIEKAREKKDYQSVQLYQRKLAQLGVATELTDYHTALALAKDGRVDEAYERMQQIAPIDEAGFILGHVWIIEQLVTGKLDVPADEAQRLLRIHLNHAEQLGAKGPQFDFVRAVLLVRENKLVDAVELLEPLASGLDQAAALRMECNIRLNRAEEARRDARMVRSQREVQQRRNASLLPHECSSWMVAEQLLENLPKAQALAQQWQALEPKNDAARRAVAELSQRLFQATISKPNPDADQLVELFLQSAEFTDDPHDLQVQFAALYRLRADSPVAQRVVDHVIASPRTPSEILEAAGTVAATLGDQQQAIDYLHRATQKDPKNSIALNNYAYLVSQQPNGDLSTAFAAVNQALAIKPDESRYLETRGQVLIRLGRWREAVADLEQAANSLPESRDIHLSLAKAYDALGNADLARVHREHAGNE